MTIKKNKAGKAKGWRRANRAPGTVTLSVRPECHTKCKEVRNLLSVLEGDYVSLSETIDQALDLLKAHTQQMLKESANVRDLMR